MKNNNEQIKCKIREIGLDVIKYNLPEYSNDVLFAIAKDDIVKIIFENGKELEFQKDMSNPEFYTANKKNILKIDFLSPLTGNTTFAYERSLQPGRSIEASLGIIGLGIDPGNRNQEGAFVKLGYKFIKDPDFYLRGMRYAHILKGGYIKPEVAFGFFPAMRIHGTIQIQRMKNGLMFFPVHSNSFLENNGFMTMHLLLTFMPVSVTDSRQRTISADTIMAIQSLTTVSRFLFQPGSKSDISSGRKSLSKRFRQ